MDMSRMLLAQPGWAMVAPMSCCILMGIAQVPQAGQIIVLVQACCDECQGLLAPCHFARPAPLSHSVCVSVCFDGAVVARPNIDCLSASKQKVACRRSSTASLSCVLRCAAVCQQEGAGAPD